VLQVELDNIAVSGDGGVFLALLTTANNDIIPIAIDSIQAKAIAMGQHPDEDNDRPFTHDLSLSIIEMLNAKLIRIEITDLKDDIFFAKLVIENRGIEFEIDARPSDALALAVRVDAPMFVAKHVIELAAFIDEDLEGIGGTGVEA